MAVLGIDWGTTNRRAYLLDAQGNLLRRHDDHCGILKVGAGNFAKSLHDLLQTLELTHVDVVMSGMVGSRNGWREASYLDSDSPLSTLPQAMIDVEAPMNAGRYRIVPGYQCIDAAGVPDVMRGEETQIFGAIVNGAPEGWFLHPGTHAKWVYVEHGRVREIITFMTGELFALLSQHGTLAGLMKEPQVAPDAFQAGLRAAQRDGFTHAAFGCRALAVTDRMPAAHASSYLSGLLIGAELADMRKRKDIGTGTTIQLIGAPTLATHYVHALQAFDIPSVTWQPDDIYIAALRVLAGIAA